jgi:hypothetical protein
MYEENAYMWRMMKEVGHTQTEIYELQGYDHGGMAIAAAGLVISTVYKIAKSRK